MKTQPRFNDQDIRILSMRYGVHLGNVQGFIEKELAMDFALAADAQPTMITESNAGIPAYLANWVDPEMITVVVSPMKAAQIIGEAKKGDWTTMTGQFPIAESTGEVSAYGDYSNNGQSSTNVNWVPRQPFHFQTITRWGEHELAMAGAGRIDYASRLNIASVLTINKAANKIAFFGVSGLQNYGLLNDPALSAPIAPAATGTGSGTTWATKDGAAIYGDIILIFQQLVAQSAGVLEQTDKMCLAMSPTSAVNLTKTNQYNVNVTDQLKKNFPNLRVETAVEYDTVGGQLVQLIADSVDGQKTAVVGFTEKLRAHPVIQHLSAFEQKKSAGSWGSIIKFPLAIAQMLGV